MWLSGGDGVLCWYEERWLWRIVRGCGEVCDGVVGVVTDEMVKK